MRAFWGKKQFLNNMTAIAHCSYSFYRLQYNTPWHWFAIVNSPVAWLCLFVALFHFFYQLFQTSYFFFHCSTRGTRFLLYNVVCFVLQCFWCCWSYISATLKQLLVISHHWISLWLRWKSDTVICHWQETREMPTPHRRVRWIEHTRLASLIRLASATQFTCRVWFYRNGGFDPRKLEYRLGHVDLLFNWTRFFR